MVSFDTLKAQQELKASGFDENQANAVVNILSLSVNTDNLVTKDEFNYKFKELDTKIQHLEDKLDTKITTEILKLQNNLYKVMGGGLVAACGVILASMRMMLN
jgi:hypothetical protein